MPCHRPDNLVASTHFLTVREVATILRRAPRTIYRWLEQGTLRGRKVKEHWLIDAREICRLLPPSDPEKEQQP